MAYTDNFRRQHQEILDIVGEMHGRLKPEQAAADPKALRSLLSALAGKLTLHLAMEDKALYPRPVERDFENSRAIANAFSQEMGGLAQAFASYNQKWQATAIGADPSGFVRETQDVFAALGRRIGRENKELYPLADRML